MDWPEVQSLQSLPNSNADFLCDAAGVHIYSLVQLLPQQRVKPHVEPFIQVLIFALGWPAHSLSP